MGADWFDAPPSYRGPVQSCPYTRVPQAANVEIACSYEHSQFRLVTRQQHESAPGSSPTAVCRRRCLSGARGSRWRVCDVKRPAAAEEPSRKEVATRIPRRCHRRHCPRVIPPRRRRASSGAGRDAQGDPPAALACNEDYWSQIQRCFDADRTIINLNNGGVSPAPSHVLDQMIRDLRFCNELPAHHMWKVLEPRIETVRRALALQFGCDAEELAITRNASEGMETLILGIDLKRGDEVIVTDQNYPRMLTTWDQRPAATGSSSSESRSRSRFRPRPSSSSGSKPRSPPPRASIEFPHITNLSGQILPVRDVVRLARLRGIDVFVDGAHSFAHFPFTRDQLDCDFFATSLHKWLLAPIGTGFLYVRKARQRRSGRSWPRRPTWMKISASTRRSVRIPPPTTTRSPRRWPSTRVSATTARQRGCAISAIAGRSRSSKSAVGSRFGRRWTTTTPHAGSGWWASRDRLRQAQRGPVRPVQDPDGRDPPPGFLGIRVTPNVYTTLAEIDAFTEAMRRVVSKGIS